MPVRRRTTPLTDAELLHTKATVLMTFEERVRRRDLRLRAIEDAVPGVVARSTEERALLLRVRRERAERELRAVQRQIAVSEKLSARRGPVS